MKTMFHINNNLIKHNIPIKYIYIFLAQSIPKNFRPLALRNGLDFIVRIFFFRFTEYMSKSIHLYEEISPSILWS